jgi:hypothetical protein
MITLVTVLVCLKKELPERNYLNKKRFVCWVCLSCCDCLANYLRRNLQPRKRLSNIKRKRQKKWKKRKRNQILIAM